MEFKDYYQTLGVAKTATADEIKKAYRKMARKYHPDVSKEPDAESRMKDVNEANAVLSDPEKRAAYDQLGSRYQGGQEFRPQPDWNAGFEYSGGGSSGGDGADFSDFFASMFGRDFRAGGAGRTPSREKGEDHHAKVLIDLEDSYAGATRTITLRVPAVDAQGHVVTKDRVLNVAIPKGIRAGQHIRLSGQGSAGEGKAGDLYLEIEFRPHTLYRIDGRDLFLDLPVAPWEAALGATVKVPTPGGIIELKIPEGSSSGRKLRLKERGIPGTPPGDCYVILTITLPPADTETAKDLYRKMAQELKFNPRAGMGV